MSVVIRGELVRKLRTENGWTQKQLADVIDRSERTVQRVEGSGCCDIETRAALAAVFKVSHSELEGAQKVEQPRCNGTESAVSYKRLTSGSAIMDLFVAADWYRLSDAEPRSADERELLRNVSSQIEASISIWSDLEPEERIQLATELDGMLKRMESSGLRLFGARSRIQPAIPARDTRGRLASIKIANFHIAY